MSRPVPKLVVWSAIRSGGGRCASPLASLRPMTAVVPLPSAPQIAQRGRPAASVVMLVRRRPPVRRTIVSTKPSPPSVIGTHVVAACGQARFTPRSIAWAACSAVSVPLNLSGAIRTRGAFKTPTVFGAA